MPAGASQGLTVLSLDGQWLKLLHVEGLAVSRRIAKALVCPVQNSSAEEIHAALKDVCTMEGLVPKEVLIANPTMLSTVRIFSLPSTDPKEIRDIVDLQAEKHTPYAKDELLMDFTIIERDPSGYSRVLLIIAHQDVIHRSVQLAEVAHLPLERVGCELEGLVNWFRLMKRPSGSSASLVVDVDSRTTTVLAMVRGQPQFQRSLATGADQVEDDPTQANDRLVGELQRSIEAWEAEGGTVKVQELYLTGRIERLGELKAAIERELNLPVHLIAPWQGLTLTESCRKAAGQLPNVSFASLIGLAFAPSEIDLTPHTMKLRQAFEARAKALVLFGFQCVSALILVSILIVGRAQKEQRYYQLLRRLYEQSAPESHRVERALVELKFVEGRLQQRGQLLEAITRLAEFSPPEIQWTSMTYIQGEGLVLKGTSQELPRVYEFAAGLERKAPEFKKVEVRRAAKRRVDGRDVADFELSCLLYSESPKIQ
jgi:type IV pilus assembly protein PilM